MTPAEDYFICSHCGAEVPIKNKICKNCGSDDSTGWSTETDPFASEPPESFDYDEAFENEFGESKNKAKFPAWVAVTAMVILFLFVYVLVR